MNTKNNAKFQETENRIQEAIFSLLKERDLRKISVRDVCTLANINRSTFYAHYLDLPDLIEQTGREMMNDIGQLFHTADSIIDFFISEEYLTKIISYIQEHRDFFDVYFNHCPPSVTEQGFSMLWEASAKPYLKKVGVMDETESWYYFTFFKAGLLAVLSQWLKNGCPETPKKLAAIILRTQPQYDTIHP